MINFERFLLKNGLKVIVHEDHTTPMAVVNVLYDVGAKDEDPDKTGFAHLFEHLMFGGSANVPVYDEPLQRVGGENNAFTTNDITNYYIQVPAINLETAFWLESDRMLSLAFSEKSLEVQRNVVVEEFKQRYLNQPYGDAWLKLRPLAYKTHPYRWATIGKDISHIEQATMQDVKAFFNKHYNPVNAILVVAGDVTVQQVKELAEKWFAVIPSGEKYVRKLPKEQKQIDERTLEITNNVPSNAIYKVFHISSRKTDEYYTADIISDLLSRGDSARLYQKLVKEKRLFSEIHAYVSGDVEDGLLVIEGKLLNGVQMQDADRAIWSELEKLQTQLVPEREFTKVLNQVESSNVFEEINLLNRAMNLAYFELLGDASLVNDEIKKYRRINAELIKSYAKSVLTHTNCSTLYYYSKN